MKSSRPSSAQWTSSKRRISARSSASASSSVRQAAKSCERRSPADAASAEPAPTSPVTCRRIHSASVASLTVSATSAASFPAASAVESLSRTPATLLTISPRAQKLTPGPYGSERPDSTRAPCGSSSASRRDLPMPGGPTTVNSAGARASRTRSSAAASSASCVRRPASGARAGGPSRILARAASASHPFSTRRYSIGRRVALRVRSSTTTPPAGTAASSQVAGPARSAGSLSSSTRASVVATAIRTCTPGSSRSSSRIASAARTARSASSSCAAGTPNAAGSAPALSGRDVPPKRSTCTRTVSPAARISVPASSGSASACTAARRVVTVRRSSRADARRTRGRGRCFACGRDVRRRRVRPRRRVQRRVVGQDGPLQTLELLAGVQSELVDERVAGALVLGQRVGLPPAPIQREHELAAQPLAVGVLGDQRRQLARQIGVAAEREVGVDARLHRAQPQILQPGRLRPGGRRIGQLAERRPTPQAQRGGELAPRRLGIAGPQRRGTGGGALLERGHIARFGGDLQHVTTGHRAQWQFGAERLAERADVHLQRRPRRGRRPADPQFLGQPVARHPLARVQHEQREERTAARAGERDRLAAARHGKRPQQTEPQPVIRHADSLWPRRRRRHTRKRLPHRANAASR